jgi:putative PEP-CTERM system TPR-repeat lipoprotein
MAALGLAACGDSGEELQEHFDRALDYRGSGDMRAAVIEFKNVLQIDPDHAQARWLLGRTYVALGDGASAGKELQRARGLGFTHAEMARATVRALLLQGQFDDALTAVKQASSSEFDAGWLVLRGQAQLGLQNVKDAKQAFDAALESDPSNTQARHGLARIGLMAGDTQAAELAPDAAAIGTQLAVSHLAAGDSDEAITELEAALASNPEFSRADVLLILTHFQNRAFDKALAAARKLVEKQPSNARLHNLLGAAYEGKKDYALARQSYRVAAELNPDYATAALNLARLSLRDGKRDQARAAYEAILETHEEQPVALVALARMASDDGRAQEGIALLERARDKNPRAIQPRLILANYHLRRGNTAQALALASETYAISPQLPAAALLLGRAQIASGMSDAAISTLSELAERYPDSVDVHRQLALAYGQKSDAANTRRALDRVLALQPGNPLATLALGNLALRTGKLDEAMKIANLLQQSQPESAAGFSLAGDVLMAGGEPRKAVSAYATALDKAPASATVLKLYAARSRAGESNAVGTLSDWLAAHPGDAAVRLAYASTLHQSGSKARAVAEYEQVLKSQPGSVLALNNLAWLYFEDGDSRALDLAQRAHHRAPERAEVIDTYGWLLIKGGRLEKGLSLLEKAAKRAPENGDIRYHLAAALAKGGDQTRARNELGTLLESGKDFPEKSAAQTLYRVLK